MSDWIPGNLTPVREGVYLRQFGSIGTFYCYWSKVGGWQVPCETPESAEKFKNRRRSKLQEQPWRGK